MRVGIIGVGNMGGRIAKRLLREGVEVGVYDTSNEAINRMIDFGAKPYESPFKLALNYSYIITILPNAEIVKQAIFGPDGIIEGLQKNSILIEMTSSIPYVTKEIGTEIGKLGAYMIDAPVSGGVKKAEEGALTIMVGGSEEVFSKVKPLFQKIGENFIHVGDLGAGHTVKALNNLVSATTLAITGEAMSLGVKLGLDPNKMLEVINSSTGRNHSSEYKFPTQILSRKFEVGFTLDLMVKDLTNVMDIASKEHFPTFISSSVFQLWQYALTQGGGKMDHTAIVKFIEEMADVEIKG